MWGLCSSLAYAETRELRTGHEDDKSWLFILRLLHLVFWVSSIIIGSIRLCNQKTLTSRWMKLHFYPLQKQLRSELANSAILFLFFLIDNRLFEVHRRHDWKSITWHRCLVNHSWVNKTSLKDSLTNIHRFRKHFTFPGQTDFIPLGGL